MEHSVSPGKSTTRQWSVRTYLIALVSACLLPGLLVGGGLIFFQYHEGREQLERNTLHTTRMLVQAVDNHLLKVQAVAQTLATSDALARGDLRRFHTKAQGMLGAEDLASNVVLRDRAGRQLVNARLPLGDALPAVDTQPQHDLVFKTREPHISPVFSGAVLKRPLVAVTVPVFMRGEVAYSLSLAVPPRHISEILQSQNLPPGWVAAALDSKGTIFGRNVDADRFVGKRATPGLYRSLMQKVEGILEATTQEGTPVLTFHSRSTYTGWNVAMGIPREQLEGTLIRRLTTLAVGMGLLFAAGLLLAWLMGGSIARSISSLTASAIALGRGERPPASDTKVKEATEVESAIQSASQLLRERALALEVGQEELRNAHQLARFGTWHWNAGTGEVQVSPSVPSIYGRDVPSFPDQRGTLLTVESWERVNAAVQEALRSGKGYDLELEVNHGDGHRIWIHAKSEAVLNDRNEVIALRGTIQDITERKRYEDALRESEATARRAAYQEEAERLRLATVLEATPVAVIVCDAEGGILQANAASKALWGESHPQTRGVADYSEWKGWWADGSDRHGRPVLPHEWPMARALREEKVAADIIEIAPFDDPARRRIVTVSCALIRNAQGQVLGGVVVQMDITDRVRAEQELRDAARRKDEFLAMLAHELRNPLAPVAAAADLLQLGASDAARVQQVSAVIARQVRHMAALIDDLLDVSRVTRGLVSLQKQPVDVNRIVVDAAEQALPLIEAKRHALSLRAPQQPVSVLGDPKRLVQIVVNLLTNAAKFTPEGGKIDVDVGLSGDWVDIAVSDNGIGMSPEVREHAFDMFAQGERAPDRSQGGLGIGLALVKSLVELHGGRVMCDSAGPGKGSRFVVTLPKAGSFVAETTPAAVDRSRDTPKVLKVMIVDDNVDAAQMLASLVETLDHEVVVEYGSHAALERARVERPALCFLDIGLPDMDGRELAHRLRSQPETAHAMLVAVTGYAQAEDRQSIKQAGFAHHFAKPIDMAQLAAVLDEAGKHAAE